MIEAGCGCAEPLEFPEEAVKRRACCVWLTILRHRNFQAPNIPLVDALEFVELVAPAMSNGLVADAGHEWVWYPQVWAPHLGDEGLAAAALWLWDFQERIELGRASRETIRVNIWAHSMAEGVRDAIEWRMVSRGHDPQAITSSQIRQWARDHRAARPGRGPRS